MFDFEINLYCDCMVVWYCDFVWNDGWVLGGIICIFDNIVGVYLWFLVNLDYVVFLCYIKGFDVMWVDEFWCVVEVFWCGFVEDLWYYNDVLCELIVL